MKILIKNFPNLNNYGTAMMGIIVIKELLEKFGNNIEIYLETDSYFNLNELKSELNIEKRSNLKFTEIKKSSSILNQLFGPKISTLIRLFHIPRSFKKFDKIIVLGGDDFSEYYSKYITSVEIFSLWKMSFFSEIILLGQTIGPFNKLINRLSVKIFARKFKIIARDPWTTAYFEKELKLPIKIMGDIAFSPLPKQENINNILTEYKIDKKNYITIVVSGLVDEGYYCNDRERYLNCYLELIQQILNNETLKINRIILLAHTYEPYGGEDKLIDELYAKVPSRIKGQITPITKKILPTRARIILGSGVLSITGRMHPAISTFQMGTPAIALSYSKKYKGVFSSIGREDLVIESNINELWNSGSIVQLILSKVIYVIQNLETLEKDILSKVNHLEKINKSAYSEL